MSSEIREPPPTEPKESWWSPRRSADLVFFDGDCGLCHWSVRFLLNHEPAGEPVLRFAPLFGETFEERLPRDMRESLPDSQVVLTPEGAIFLQGRAVRRLLDHLGGFWRGLGLFLRLVPLPLLDLAYRIVAALRLRLFRRPDSTCPLVPPELRERFLP